MEKLTLLQGGAGLGGCSWCPLLAGNVAESVLCLNAHKPLIKLFIPLLKSVLNTPSQMFIATLFILVKNWKQTTFNIQKESS